jgi:signal transduction histidine kinase
MPPFATYFRRRYLALGFLAVLVPLVVLLVLQSVWLTRLEEMSVIAHRAALSSFVDAVGRDVRAEYQRAGDVLEIPPASDPGTFRDRLRARWTAEYPEVARRLFLLDFSRSAYGNVLFFDRESHTLVSPAASDEALAIIVAGGPWQIAAMRGNRAQERGRFVDERNPAHRMILDPFVDEQGTVVALVGIILDEERFRDTVLPALVKRKMEDYFSPYVRERVRVVVSDGRMDTPVWNGGQASVSEEADQRWEVASAVPYVFTDWTVTLEGSRLDPERWARAGFAFNMTLAGLLAVALLGGLALALRAANRAIRLSEMKSDFVSNVSHELRTPVASIRTFGELLKLGHAPPEKVREYGEHIESESRRLSRLIDNILDFARIESGRKTYRFQSGRLERIVERAVKSFEVRTRSDGFRFSLEIPDGPLPEMRMDPDAIGQVLYNLLDNAVKYSGESRRIDVAVRREEGTAVCVIRDHGVGIAVDQKDRIFERFHRVGTGLVHDVKGSGLGLSIVQHVVAAHDGQVAVDSEPGRGTTVTLRLPLPPPEGNGGSDVHGPQG